MKHLIVITLVVALVAVIGVQSVIAEEGDGGTDDDPQSLVWCAYGVSLPGAGIAVNNSSRRVNVKGDAWLGFGNGYEVRYTTMQPGETSHTVGICDADAIDYNYGNPDLWAYHGPRAPNSWPDIGPGTTTCEDPASWLQHYAVVCG